VRNYNQSIKAEHDIKTAEKCRKTRI